MGLAGIRMDHLWAGNFSTGQVTLPKSILDYNFLIYQNGFGSISMVLAGSRMQAIFVFNANNNIYTATYLIIADSPTVLRVHVKATYVILDDGTSQMFAGAGEPITAIYGIKI